MKPVLILALARYLRFRALSEVQGKEFTAVAELSVVGTPTP